MSCLMSQLPTVELRRRRRADVRHKQTRSCKEGHGLSLRHVGRPTVSVSRRGQGRLQGDRARGAPRQARLGLARGRRGRACPRTFASAVAAVFTREGPPWHACPRARFVPHAHNHNALRIPPRRAGSDEHKRRGTCSASRRRAQRTTRRWPPRHNNRQLACRRTRSLRGARRTASETTGRRFSHAGAATSCRLTSTAPSSAARHAPSTTASGTECGAGR